ncbi:PREDICTED: torsin-3A [Tinamus guttatus]|uniref:torsin-3A n=1 Tax=Tinamus guttatus TaxID=94827 RepID=UPI00052EB07F|nr:PREDICTED: torsin-3A [Tinamus guttatus]
MREVRAASAYQGAESRLPFPDFPKAGPSASPLALLSRSLGLPLTPCWNAATKADLLQALQRTAAQWPYGPFQALLVPQVSSAPPGTDELRLGDPSTITFLEPLFADQPGPPPQPSWPRPRVSEGLREAAGTCVAGCHERGLCADPGRLRGCLGGGRPSCAPWAASAWGNRELLCGDRRPSAGWSLPLVGHDYLEILSAWYCSFGRCCDTGDCRVLNNVTGLELDLNGQLHGQHLAREVVIRAVRGFLQSPRPEKALVLSFHGWSGTGKNFVARMVAGHLYRDGLRSECVRMFISLFHFPHHQHVDSYKVQLEKQISETTQLCRQSLFIFDEAEKLHFGLLDAIKPFMAHYNNKGQAGNWRSIFLFLSNIGGNTINEVALDFWRAGRLREEIPMELLEQRWLQPADSLDEVAKMMVFVPEEEQLFSAQGCKSVSQRINYFLP